MRLLFCLRRALAGLRSGVGGPLHFRDLCNLAPIRFKIFQQRLSFPGQKTSLITNVLGSKVGLIAAVPQLVDRTDKCFERFFNTLQITLQKLLLQCHLAILPARSHRRHGPFVLGFTGGNA